MNLWDTPGKAPDDVLRVKEDGTLWGVICPLPPLNPSLASITP